MFEVTGPTVSGKWDDLMKAVNAIGDQVDRTDGEDKIEQQKDGTWTYRGHTIKEIKR